MAGNAIGNAEFFNPANYWQTFLDARGFTGLGQRSGGIIDPKRVTITEGSILGRFFQSDSRRYGQWWWTLAEMEAIVAYFGRYGTDPDAGGFGTGRKEGKGILQGTLAVRTDWREEGTTVAQHMERFCFARVTTNIDAFFGEGDVAPSSDQRSVLKPVHITDRSGTRRGARQIFLPKLWLYADKAMTSIEEGQSDSDLLAALTRYNTAPLYFES